MAFEKITSRKIYEQIADQMKEHIMSGGWKTGEKLPSTKELTEQFQVGRSTMREALSALKAMGLIEIRHGDGCFVREVTADELPLPQFETLLLSREAISELLEARKALEIANAAIAAQKRTDEDLAAFEVLLASMKEHIGDQAEGEAADIRFHQLLSEATHNSIMVRLLDSIASQMEIAIRETRRIQMYSSKQVSLQLWEEHQRIYEAVAAQNPEEAQQSMRAHLEHVEKMLREYLDRK
ncbi:FadR/GntR family transcriptional regulator [Paenibacillus abyssi]|uniref:HTH-type transcriptional regulator LutR n=1 Tax=Paenibacillus abyssi TaxID=1340531 RepID=A0A917CW58_9BACL|nr:FadR/GntR family transcriptional regulator [Paenibacillus abyssi]GGF99703.1 HTH-type transcriptional regulator LutR [Paenibacillus abyssi]